MLLTLIDVIMVMVYHYGLPVDLLQPAMGLVEPFSVADVTLCWLLFSTATQY